MPQMPDDLVAAAPRPALQEPAEYRKALSCFATGVTVITARWQGSDWGMTCNSFASVSLEPRLVFWSIRKAATSLEAFKQSGGLRSACCHTNKRPLHASSHLATWLRALRVCPCSAKPTNANA